jgi:hypothetical protein
VRSAGSRRCTACADCQGAAGWPITSIGAASLASMLPRRRFRVLVRVWPSRMPNVPSRLRQRPLAARACGCRSCSHGLSSAWRRRRHSRRARRQSQRPCRSQPSERPRSTTPSPSTAPSPDRARPGRSRPRRAAFGESNGVTFSSECVVTPHIACDDARLRCLAAVHKRLDAPTVAPAAGCPTRHAYTAHPARGSQVLRRSPRARRNRVAGVLLDDRPNALAGRCVTCAICRPSGRRGSRTTSATWR